jgi:hypothetical protein
MEYKKKQIHTLDLFHAGCRYMWLSPSTFLSTYPTALQGGSSFPLMPQATLNEQKILFNRTQPFVSTKFPTLIVIPLHRVEPLKGQM